MTVIIKRQRIPMQPLQLLCICGRGKYYPADDCNIGTRYGASNQILPKPTMLPPLIRHKKAKELKPEPKSDQDSGDKSRSKRKKRENSKTIPQVLYFKRKWRSSDPKATTYFMDPLKKCGLSAVCRAPARLDIMHQRSADCNRPR
jgi:hypothetical protein